MITGSDIRNLFYSNGKCVKEKFIEQTFNNIICHICPDTKIEKTFGLHHTKIHTDGIIQFSTGKWVLQECKRDVGFKSVNVPRAFLQTMCYLSKYYDDVSPIVIKDFKGIFLDSARFFCYIKAEDINPLMKTFLPLVEKYDRVRPSEMYIVPEMNDWSVATFKDLPKMVFSLDETFRFDSFIEDLYNNKILDKFMELTLEQLMLGKATKIRDKEYYTTEAYVTPFIERVSKMTDNLIINVKPADQISLTKEGEINFEDAIYNRVWIQGVLPDEFAWDNHRRVISMLYALDTRKPLVKFYVGALNMACLNLCVFDPDMLNVAELEPEKAINYNFLGHAMEMTDTIHSTLKTLADREYKRDDMFAELGHWVDNCITSKINTGFGNVKMPESSPIDVYKDLFYDEKSEYYTEDDRVDGFTVYNAFTDLITQDKRDLVNKFEKTLLIKDIMGI